MWHVTQRISKAYAAAMKLIALCHIFSVQQCVIVRLGYHLTKSDSTKTYHQPLSVELPLVYGYL